MLTALAEKLHEMHSLQTELADPNDVIAEFTNSANVGDMESLSQDVVNILKFLCGKLACQQSSMQTHQMEPLLLEGIYAILCNVPVTLRSNKEFISLIWQDLCPSLIYTLGNPKLDRSVTSQKTGGSQEEMGRGSGCSGSAPSVHSSAAKTIYNIAVELVRLVGNMRSLRPVLESVFHRMLLYPPPQHRHDALKALKELMSTPERLMDLAGPTLPDDSSKVTTNTSSKRKMYNDVALLKLIVDSIQECCHCNDSQVCITSVNLIDSLLTTVEQLSQGKGLDPHMVLEIQQQYTENEGLDAGAFKTRLSSVSSQSHGTNEAKENKLAESQSSANTNEAGSVSETLPEEEEEDSYHDDETAPLNKEDCRTVNYQPKLHDQEEIAEELKCRLNPAAKVDFDAIERQNAQDFIQRLVSWLPELLVCSNILQVDEEMQKFASNFCAGLSEQDAEGSSAAAILNADGVYLATCHALLLNLKLIVSGYYQSEEKSLPISEEQFVDEILGNGLLLYLSQTWLSELYHQVIHNNVLETAGYVYQPETQHLALIQVLTNVDGLSSRHIGGQLLYDQGEHTQEQRTDPESIDNKLALESGMQFARRLLVACWDGILDVLSVLLNGKNSCGITSSLALMLGTEGAKEESLRAREAICTSLDGLQKAARMSCKLGLQDRCGAVFAQLSNASCVKLTEAATTGQDKKGSKPVNRSKLARLHAAYALSMDLVLSIGLEMGSHSADCWRHVFRCCVHVSELEHTYFSSGNNQSNLPKVQQEQHQLDTNSIAMDDSELYTPMLVPMEPVAPSINVPELIKQSSVESGWDSTIAGGGVLGSAQTSKVLCGLSQQVDRLFEEAATKLNMRALVSFLAELCKSSQLQLSQTSRYTDPYGGSSGLANVPTNSLHIYRLGDVILKCLRSGRPLMHMMRAWSVVAPHLVEAACHKDRKISKKAVDCIHECITTLLAIQEELPHFHFNESLCKPFENLLCLELIDGDVQDQVVCSICELVEACATEIRSGWRSLFAALRAVKIEYTTVEEINEARQRHVAAVLDVFNVFLNTDNVLVFANAAVDCILCLLKYVRGPGEFENIGDNDSDSGSDLPCGSTEDLCLPALQYLQQCCSILASMWNMPACPIFNGAHRIKMTCISKSVDPVIPNVNMKAFQQQYFIDNELLPPSGQHGKHDISIQDAAPFGSKPAELTRTDDRDSKSFISVDSGIGGTSQDGTTVNLDKDETKTSTETHIPGYSTPADGDQSTGIPETQYKMVDIRDPHDADREKLLSHFSPIALEDLDNHTGILHVWVLVLEGLASTVSTCPKNYQPQTLEMLFELLQNTAQIPGADFSIYCANHLVLPMLQSWLRRGNQISGYWDTSAANFKQCCGLCSDLVVEYIIQFGHVTACHSGVELMVKQLLDVLVECIAQPVESLSRLGCACIRHCLLSAGPMLSEQMWYTVALSLQRAFDVSLYCLKQVMTLFHPNSDNFYGDIGHVKVAVRKDCSGIECERLRLLAQQVFLLESQQGTSSLIDYEVEEDRSYIFLLYPPGNEKHANPDQAVTRVPFRSIVVGLLAHQLLLQTVGCLLLKGTGNMIPSERNLMPSSPTDRSPSMERDEVEDDALLKETQLPGIMRHLSARNALLLLQCLQDSNVIAAKFDSRPGLKFLMQKVARADVATNLYKQAGVSMTFLVHALMEICAHQDNISVDNIKHILAEKTTRPVIDTGKLEDSEDGKIVIRTEDSEEKAKTSKEYLLKHAGVFVRKLKESLDTICSTYVDLYLDKEGTTCADRLSEKSLVFLLAEPEELPSLKRSKKVSEIVAEKLKMVTGAADGSLFAVEPVCAQAQDDQAAVSPAEGDSVPSSPEKDKTRDPASDQRVYTVATDRTIKDLMSAYKKRKQQHTLPTFVKATRSKPSMPKKERPHSMDPEDVKIDQQQKSSIMKDSEAHLISWTEMICNLLQLFHQLPDYQYHALLPVFFSCVNQLICHCNDAHLRECLAQWVHRVGHMCGIAPLEEPAPTARV